jgi:sucrose-phosphate synthase
VKIAFLNPQGNFDPQDRYWTEHPDFGGQLVYVKELALALGRLGHSVDIVTRRIRDPNWLGFESDLDGYPNEPNVRIVRIPCGGNEFLRKEDLWPHLGTEWVPNIEELYAREGQLPDFATTHYGDGGLAGALWKVRGGPPFTFTGHSLGAQKLDRLLEAGGDNINVLDDHYRFSVRLAAERVAMHHSDRVITSTRQERFQQYAHAAYRGAIDPSDDGKFAVVPPGVNLRIFDIAAGSEDDRIAAHLETVIARDIATGRQELPPVICSSRLDPKKNHIALVEAFGRSPKLNEAANLLIVVRGTESIQKRGPLSPDENAILDKIVALINQFDLWGAVSVFSLESQLELAAAYRYLRARRGVFALTALYEPFGLAPLEAMACGLPAVVTQSGGPSESLQEGGRSFGVLVDPTDPLDIASGLNRLVSSEKEWSRMHDLGRQRVLDQYTWERTAEGYLRALKPRPTEPLPVPKYFVEPSPENAARLQNVADLWAQATESEGNG